MKNKELKHFLTHLGLELHEQLKDALNVQIYLNNEPKIIIYNKTTGNYLVEVNGKETRFKYSKNKNDMDVLDKYYDQIQEILNYRIGE